MRWVSTRGQSPVVDFKEALFNGLAPDGGLYIPTFYPKLDARFFSDLAGTSFLQLSEAIMGAFLPELPTTVLTDALKDSLNFPIPLIALEEQFFLLEVFHGPTLAFKDVGARFMAKMLTYYLQQENRKLALIVATSGDTGSAIAHGFFGIPGIDVYILYPSGKISFQQEQQMTTLGGNIHALEVKGTFDDCQRLVKAVLLDKDIQHRCCITTANSINIARLLPQVIYHSYGIQQLLQKGISMPPTLSVPSGNFGNLTAALYAKALGFSVRHFIAATNLNAIIPNFLATGKFVPEPSKISFSNAMDVGNPSNFERLSAFFTGDITRMREAITGVSVTDDEVVTQISQTYQRTHYLLDPHTAVGVVAAKKYYLQDPSPIIITATAHPAKFPEVIHRAVDVTIPIPSALQTCLTIPKHTTLIDADFETVKEILLRGR